MRWILETLLFVAVSIAATVIIICLVVIPSPTEFSSYAALSLVLIFDGISLYVLIPAIFLKKPRRKRPKTVSKQLSLWLLAVAYAGVFGFGMLTDSYVKCGAVVLLVFACVCGVILLGSFVWLTIHFIAYLKIKCCLAFGERAEGKFVEMKGDITFGLGNPNRRGRHFYTYSSVKFEYFVNGRKMVGESKRVFSDDEILQLKNMKSFKVKYLKNTAVVAEEF